MNEATLQKFGFQQIRETLASFCSTAPGRQLARSMMPVTRTEQVRAWLAQVRELLDSHEEHGLPPMGGVHDIRGHVRGAAFPTPLEAEALAEVAETLAATVPLRSWFEQLGEGRSTLKRIGERVVDLHPIADVINNCIDARGQMRDYASPKLAAIRGAILDSRDRVRGVFERVLRQASLSKMLQYAGTTFHSDRMVLPLKAEYRGRVPGIIHRTSDTGSTLFVEPAESVELNNTIVRLRDEESKEITRILRDLSQRVQANAEVILGTARAMAVLDLMAAKVRYAKKRSCTIPDITDDATLDLHDARHPLLLELFDEEATADRPGRDVVPIDVRLGDDFDILIVTGPNTGGKTVALKTVGLFVSMTQCGIPIPAAVGSKMPVYREIFIDIGDEQSLEQSLSTFSSHLATLLDILRRSGPRSLVLIDELGAGTDPDEGAAIGRAIVAELLKLKTKAIISTHLSDLKAIAFTTARVDNAAVEFDPKSLKPTYHLRLGEPGNSNAMIIAKRLGMPARIVKHAKDLMADRTQALNRAIAGTLDSRRAAEEARRAARKERIDAESLQTLYREKCEALQQLHRAFQAWVAWVKGLRPGDEVFIRSLKRRGRVVRVQLQQQTALVSARGMDIELPLRDMEVPSGDS